MNLSMSLAFYMSIFKRRRVFVDCFELCTAWKCLVSFILRSPFSSGNRKPYPSDRQFRLGDQAQAKIEFLPLLPLENVITILRPVAISLTKIADHTCGVGLQFFGSCVSG
jgi:hypothetical protein